MKSTRMKSAAVLFASGLVLLAGCSTETTVVAPSGPPLVNINPNHHGNLAAAQQLIYQAYNKIIDAQRANQGQLGGHAQNAKNLLTQASQELSNAAAVANAEGR